MIDWSSVFDEAYPVAGASTADIERFVAAVGQPLSTAEVKEINRGQRNPFTKGDALFASWRPFDPSFWMVPDQPLPPPYLAFLEWSNGGEFRTGDRWFQFFPVLDPGHGVRAMLLAYHLPQYMAGALPFAFDGGGTFYMFDMRHQANRGEYPVVCAHSGNLGWEPDECSRIAESFEAACRNTGDVDERRTRRYT